MQNKVIEGLGFGYLYNWYAVSDAKFAPTDWRVPTGTSSGGDYQVLRDYLGGWTVAGGKLKETGTTRWDSPNTGADNSAGFYGIGGGSRNGDNGGFTELKEHGTYYGKAVGETSTFKSLGLTYNDDNGNLISANNGFGFSVRLIYEGAGTPTTVTDYDGNEYDVVVIGTQRWTVQNWKCIHLNDGTSLTKVTGNAAWAALTTEGYCAYDNDESNV